MPIQIDLAQFPRLVCRRCGLVALVDPSLPADDQSTITCPQCRGRLGRPRVLPTQLPDEPPAASRAHPPVVRPAPLPSNAVVALAIAAIFLVLLVGFFLFLLLTPHTAHVNPYYPKP